MGMIVRNEKTYTGISSASLSSLTDVALETPVNGQGLVYNEESQMWVNGEVASGGSGAGAANIGYGLARLSADFTGPTDLDFRVPFDLESANNNLKFDVENHGYILKAGKTYQVEGLARAIGYSSYRYFNIYDETNKVAIGVSGGTETTGSYADATTPAVAIVTPETDILVTLELGSTSSETQSTTLTMTSYLKVVEIAATPQYVSGTLKPWLYSEEETIIGNYLGKPLYRKVISVPGVVELTKQNNIYFAYFGMTTSLGLELGTIINASGTILRAQDGFETTRYTFPFTDTWNKESLMYLHWFPTGLKIESQIDQSQSGIVFSDPIFTVEYIKNSDEEGSGDSLMPYCGGSSASSINYSTEEQIIGTWIDGSTLYQKTYDITGITIDANKWYSYPIDNTEINTIVKIEGYRVAPNQTTPLNQSATSNGAIQGCTFSYNSNIPGFYIIPTSDNTDTQIHYYITIQYTKK